MITHSLRWGGFSPGWRRPGSRPHALSGVIARCPLEVIEADIKRLEDDIEKMLKEVTE